MVAASGDNCSDCWIRVVSICIAMAGASTDELKGAIS